MRGNFSITHGFVPRNRLSRTRWRKQFSTNQRAASATLSDLLIPGGARKKKRCSYAMH
jgi:hypothetical protein